MREPENAAQSGLLTINQVAERLGICRAHVYKLINKGLPVIRLGRLVRIHITSLENWLKDQEQAST